MTNTADVKLPPTPEIVITRLFDAPRELVFEAFSDPGNIGKWWGPDGFTAYDHRMDFRVGGVWRFEMRGPDGKLYPNYSVYTEISPPQRIAYDHFAGEAEERMFKALIALSDESGKTRVTFSLICTTLEKWDFLVSFGAIKGAQQTLARLAGYLSQSKN